MLDLPEFAKQYFDLTKNKIDQIAIYETYAENNCFIAEDGNKLNIYNGFILCDSLRTQTRCDVSFYRSGNSGKYTPRIIFKKVNKKNNLEKTTDKEFVRISFLNSEDGYEQFWKMIAFLSRFKDLVDLGEFSKEFKVVSTSEEYIYKFKNKEQARQISELAKLVAEANLDEFGIKKILTDTRKKILEEFRKLLFEENYWKFYEVKNKIKLKGVGEEAVWHYFLKENAWILGLNLDIRFIRDLIDEVNIGNSDSEGKGSPKSDFLGITDYTILVEIKTPSTFLFTDIKKTTARANTWSFSDNFIDGISQCLGQKFDWDKYHKSKKLINNEMVINQDLVRTLDPKSIFIIGSKTKEIPETSTNNDILIKRDTFELFRRNNRNIEILTYDELYDRAYFIVYNKKRII